MSLEPRTYVLESSKILGSLDEILGFLEFFSIRILKIHVDHNATKSTVITGAALLPL
jgi:hypothetical protein